MIQQVANGLDSRSIATPFKNGLLPLITAPMSSVVDEHNYHVFWENNIQICFPRTANVDEIYNDVVYKDAFHSLSLEEFIANFIDNTRPIGSRPVKRCIDTANGNMPALHEAIRKAKEIHGDKLVIMAGNVASVEAFVELAKTGVDYIRVGIGGGSGCNTTSNTGVGQKNLKKLIKKCDKIRKNVINNIPYWREIGIYKKDNAINPKELDDYNLGTVKIIADGISSWVDYCQKEYGYNDNGYAAINELLFAGADLVMVGKLFAQCVESAGEKGIETLYNIQSFDNWVAGMSSSYNFPKTVEEYFYRNGDSKTNKVFVKYAGMSTHAEQRKYNTQCIVKPSEGSVQWIPVRWSLQQWLFGSVEQDTFPYLMGWINSIKSAMSYAGKASL